MLKDSELYDNVKVYVEWMNLGGRYSEGFNRMVDYLAFVNLYDGNHSISINSQSLLLCEAEASIFYD